MIYEFALDPQLLKTWNACQFLLSQFGNSKGRWISRYPKSWKQLALAAAESAKEKEYLQIVEALSEIEPNLLPRFHGFDKGMEWLPNAIDENRIRPFRAIIANENPEQLQFILCPDQLSPIVSKQKEPWRVPISMDVRRTASKLANCVAPLLRNCKRVLFVDPYFGNVMSRHLVALQEFLRCIASRDTQMAMPQTIEYHTGDSNKDTNAFAREMEKSIRPYLPAATTLTIVRWREEELHNRYLLTDRGGVTFGTGLDIDESANPSEDTVTLLDEQHCLDLLIKYSSESKSLKWLNQIYRLKA